MDRRPSSYRSSSDSSKPSCHSCVICFKSQSIYSIGSCDHPVCYECSTSMRVLRHQNKCPICRRILTKVIFTKDELDLFKNLEERSYPIYNKTYGIAFGDLSVKNSFDQLLRCYCKKCYKRPEFTSFEELTTHMEQKHRLYACRLCVNNIKMFPSQRRWYNYDELTRHEECGDSDNTSHRGHPECQLCKVRYLDIDELYKHQTDKHLFCHICDDDGIEDDFYHYNNSNNYSGLHESSAATSSDRAINVRNTADFPSLNGQHTTVLPCARTWKQNQSVNTRDLHSFPALEQDPQLLVAPKAQKPPMNSTRMAAAIKKTSGTP